MALGGGTFTAQNKILPGTYINFISASRSSATLSDRGYAAMALELDWGVDAEIFTVTAEDFQKRSLQIFGYDFTHAKLKGLRDLFKNIRTGYFYNLNTGEKAKCTFATARFRGTRGNDITITISPNVDANEKFDVVTRLEGLIVDNQVGVSDVTELLDNDFIVWKRESEIEITAGTPLIGGTNIVGSGAEYQSFLDKLESYSFNTLGCLSNTAEIIALYVAYTKRMRDDVGMKFQTVVFQMPSDFEGVISLENSVDDELNSSLVYWVTGVTAGCPINRSNTNKKYDGEFDVNVEYPQNQLEAAIKAGKFILHQVGTDIRVLMDINSFISFTDEKNSDFSSNQTIRVLDQIANDIAVLFNTRYLGVVQNSNAGRISLWNDIVTFNKELERLQAIENFLSDDVSVQQGNSKDSVIVSNAVTTVNAMTKLYMTVIVQ